MQDGIGRLAQALAENQHAHLGDVANGGLSLAAGSLEDDAAVLALRLPLPPGTPERGA